MVRSSRFAALVALTACRGERGPAPQVPLGEGRLAVPGGTIWYKVSGSGGGTPVVLLHGGPGMSSYYLTRRSGPGRTTEHRSTPTRPANALCHPA
jgi:hypothetical protein